MYSCLKLQLTNTRNCKNWVTYVKSLLYELGFIESWENDDLSYLTPNLIKQLLRDQYKQNILASLATFSRLSISCQYKQNDYFENYLDAIYSSLLYVICGVLNVNIELGIFDNTPREQRICLVYNMNAIENEYHFILYVHVTETSGPNIVPSLRLINI